jgi:hypothetical protein
MVKCSLIYDIQYYGELAGHPAAGLGTRDTAETDIINVDTQFNTPTKIEVEYGS